MIKTIIFVCLFGNKWLTLYSKLFIKFIYFPYLEPLDSPKG